MLEHFHAQLLQRQRAIEQECFDSPPTDFAQFQHRLGAHIEVTRLINDIAAEIQGREDDLQ